MKRSATTVEVIIGALTLLGLLLGNWVISREQAAQHETRIQTLERDAQKRDDKIDRIDQNTQEIRILLERKQDIKP
jgi:Tfp pilus assembly protein PilN